MARVLPPFAVQAAKCQTAEQHLIPARLSLVNQSIEFRYAERKNTHLIHYCCYYSKGGPSYLIDPIASKLSNATKYDKSLNDYVIDCDDQSLGNLEFTFGKFKVVLTPGDYIWKYNVSSVHGWKLCTILHLHSYCLCFVDIFRTVRAP